MKSILIASAAALGLAGAANAQEQEYNLSYIENEGVCGAVFGLTPQVQLFLTINTQNAQVVVSVNNVEDAAVAGNENSTTQISIKFHNSGVSYLVDEAYYVSEDVNRVLGGFTNNDIGLDILDGLTTEGRISASFDDRSYGPMELQAPQLAYQHIYGCMERNSPLFAEERSPKHSGGSVWKSPLSSGLFLAHMSKT